MASRPNITAELEKAIESLNIGTPSSQRDGVLRQQNSKKTEKQEENVGNDKQEKQEEKKESVDLGPVELPPQYSWATMDAKNPKQLQEICDLMNDRTTPYLRLDYSVEFLKWFLTPPGYQSDWHVGVYEEKKENEDNKETKENNEKDKPSRKLISFSAATPRKLSVCGEVMDVAQVVFRSGKNSTLLRLIDIELIRRCKLTGIDQIVVITRTELANLGDPIAEINSSARLLNPKKAVDFRRLNPREIVHLRRSLKPYELPKQYWLKNFRRIEPKEMFHAHSLFKKHVQKTSMFPIYTQNQFKHWFTPRENIVDSYVVLDRFGKITDFASYYWAPSYTSENETGNCLTQSFLLYLIAERSPKHRLMCDTFIAASKSKIDMMFVPEVLDRNTTSGQRLEPGNCKLLFYFPKSNLPRVASDKLALNII